MVGQKPKSEITTVAFPVDTVQALDQEAERTQIGNRSAVIRMAVQFWLDSRKAVTAQNSNVQGR